MRDFSTQDGGQFGDRRQEIVFIGVNVDKTGIIAVLDAALVTDAEFQEYTAKVAAQLPDPQLPWWPARAQ